MSASASSWVSVVPDRIVKWGQALLIVGGLLGGGYTLTARAVSTIKAGPEAKAEAASLNVRVGKLERQSCFFIRGIEKVAKIKYAHPEECEQ